MRSRSVLDEELMFSPDVTVVGGGLAGCEAAWQLARHGLRVLLVEMKPENLSAAGDALRELGRA